MRKLSFRLDHVVEVAENARIEIWPELSAVPPVERSAHVAGMASTVPGETLAPAFALFDVLDGRTARSSPIQIADNKRLIIPLDESALAQQWRVAMLLNLIDFATFVDADDPELRQIEKVLLATPLECSPAGTYSRLSEMAEWAAGKILSLEGSKLLVDGEAGESWPVDSMEYAYAAGTTFDKPVGDSAAPMLETIDTLLAWSAFATSGSSTQWIEKGWTPYPVEITAKGPEVKYRLEAPPNDIAFPLLLFEKVVEQRLSVKVLNRSISISTL